MSLNKKYKSSEIVKYYASNRNSWGNFYKSERKVIEKLNITKNSKILDIGCACGGLGEVLKKKYGIKDYTGIEINKKAYEYGKFKNKKFNFINSDILKWPPKSRNNRQCGAFLICAI